MNVRTRVGRINKRFGPPATAIRSAPRMRSVRKANGRQATFRMVLARARTAWHNSAVKVWLVGERGMLASAVRQELVSARIPWLGTGRNVDIADLSAVEEYATSESFTHIINCAGFTDVDGAEAQAENAERTNAQGPANLWQVCQERGATLLHYSTDYVFAGTASIPYKESDAAAPVGVYAATKLRGEQALLGSPHAIARAYVARTSWLFGPAGKNFVATMLRLMATRQELRVVADQIGRPTYTIDLAQASLKLCGLDGVTPPSKPGIYHVANSGPTSWHGFALEIWRQAKAAGLPILTEVVTPITTAEFPTAARRPAYSVLDTSLTEQSLDQKSRPWQEALADYLIWHKVQALT